MFTKEELLTMKELADKLKVSTETIRRWRLQGMPIIELGESTTRYQLGEVMKWRVEIMQAKKKA